MILVNKKFFYYKNHICLYEMLHVLTFEGHQQDQIKNKEDWQISCHSDERDLSYSPIYISYKINLTHLNYIKLKASAYSCVTVTVCML